MGQLVLHLIHTYEIDQLPLYVLITLLASGVLSFILGLERELRGEPTGLSPHVLVCTSCSLLMTISIWAIWVAEGGGEVNYDTSRIAASIVSGVGFLGAGAILKHGPNVRGLSTAASLWASSAIGMACGAGLVLEAAIGTAITMTALFICGRAKQLVDNRLPCLKVFIRGEAAIVTAIYRLSTANGIVIREIQSDPIHENDAQIEVRVLFAYRTAPVMILDLGRSLLREANVLYVEFNDIRLP